MANEVLGTAFVEIMPKLDQGAFSRTMNSAGAAGARALGNSLENTASRQITSALESSASTAGRTATSKFQSIGQSAGNAFSRALGRGTSGAASGLHEVQNAAGATGRALNSTVSDANRAATAVERVGTKATGTAGGFAKGRAAAGQMFSTVLSSSGSALGPLVELQEKTFGIGQAFSSAEGRASKALIGIGAGVLSLGILFNSAATQDKVAEEALSSAIEATGKHIDDYGGRLKAADNVGAKYGYTVAQTDNALAQLVRITGNTDTAFNLLAGTVEYADVRHKGLEQSALKVGRAFLTGGTTAKLLGLDLQSVSQATKNAATDDNNAQKAKDNYTKATQKLLDLENSGTATTKQLADAQGAVKDAEEKVTKTTQDQAKAHEAVKTAQDKQKNAGKQLSDLYQGAADTAAKSFTGRMKKLGAEVENTTASIGKHLGGVLIAIGPLLLGVGAIIQSGVGAKLAGLAGQFTRLRTAEDGVVSTTFLGKLVGIGGWLDTLRLKAWAARDAFLGMSLAEKALVLGPFFALAGALVLVNHLQSEHAASTEAAKKAMQDQWNAINRNSLPALEGLKKKWEDVIKSGKDGALGLQIANKGFDELNGRIKQITPVVDALSKKFGLNADQVGALAQKYKVDLNTSIPNAEKKFEDVINKLTGVKGATGEVIAAQDKLKQSTTDLNNANASWSGAIKVANDELNGQIDLLKGVSNQSAITGADLVKNVNDSIAAIANERANITKLQSEGVNNAFLQALIKEGPEDVAAAASLGSDTAKALGDRYVVGVQQHMSLGVQVAKVNAAGTYKAVLDAQKAYQGALNQAQNAALDQPIERALQAGWNQLKAFGSAAFPDLAHRLSDKQTLMWLQFKQALPDNVQKALAKAIPAMHTGADLVAGEITGALVAENPKATAAAASIYKKVQGQIDLLHGKELQIILKDLATGNINALKSDLLDLANQMANLRATSILGVPSDQLMMNNPKYQSQGGWIPGWDFMGKDNIPAMLTAGEFVMKTAAVAQHGVGAMSALNQGKARIVPAYATGGFIDLDFINRHTENDLPAANQLGSLLGHVGNADSNIRNLVSQAAATAAAAGSVGGSDAAKAYAAALLRSHGWGQDQFPPLLALWNRESGWNPNAVNASSGAYGIPQALGHGNVFALGDYQAQVDWGENYIAQVYGSPAAAWAHSQATGWYGRGGLVGYAAGGSVSGAMGGISKLAAGGLPSGLNAAEIAYLTAMATKIRQQQQVAAYLTALHNAAVKKAQDQAAVAAYLAAQAVAARYQTSITNTTNASLPNPTVTPLAGTPYASPTGLTGTDAAGNTVPVQYNALGAPGIASALSEAQGATARAAKENSIAAAARAQVIAHQNQIKADQTTYFFAQLAINKNYAKLLTDIHNHASAAITTADEKIIQSYADQRDAMAANIALAQRYITFNNELATAATNAANASTSAATAANNQAQTAITNATAAAKSSIQQSLTTAGQQGTGIADVFSVQAGYGPSSAAGAVAVLQSKVQNLRAFVANLKILAAKGVDIALIADLANAGPDAAGTIAQQLIADPSITTQLGDLYSQLSNLENNGASLLTNTAINKSTGKSTANTTVDPTGALKGAGGSGNLVVQGDLIVQDASDVAKISQALFTVNQNSNRALG